MRIAVGLVAALAFAAPALADTPAPSFVHFEHDYPSTLFTASGSPCDPALDGAADGSRWLQTRCQSPLELAFSQSQASVELLVHVVEGPADIVATASTSSGAVVAATVASTSGWDPVVLAAPGGAASITSVDVRAAGHNLELDDLARSPSPQPDTAIRSGPAAVTTDTGATFAFASNRPDATTFVCSLDGAALAPCGLLSGLALGDHVLRAAAVDAYGAVDPSPASYGWAVVPRAPDAQAGVVGAMVVFSSPNGGVSFQCSVDGGAFTTCTSPFAPGGRGEHRVQVRAIGAQGQVGVASADVIVPADDDHDLLPDRREELPIGDLVPIPGVRVHAEVDAGTVTVRLPHASEDVPFAGNATLPVGSRVNALNGTVTVQVASNRFAQTDRRYRSATVTLSEGIFTIRQARLRKVGTRVIQIPVEFGLVSPPGAELRCRRNAASKGVVRTLTASGKGVFRVRGGASVAEGRDAAWTTTDRCDGTLTRVSRAHVRVRAQRRSVVVRRSHRYFVKARLFQARKGR